MIKKLKTSRLDSLQTNFESLDLRLKNLIFPIYYVWHLDNM